MEPKTQVELAGLGESPVHSRPWGVRADDRSTWPPEVLDHVNAADLKVDPDVADRLGQYRERAATQIVIERLGDKFLFCMAALRAMADRVPFDSLEGALLDELQSWVFGMIEDAVSHTLDIAPAVLTALPYESGKDLLASIQAKLAAEQSE